MSTRPQHKTLNDRADAARDFSCKEGELSSEIPIYLDSMGNDFNALYSVWPERVIIIEGSGHIGFLQQVDEEGSKRNAAIEVDQWLASRFPLHRSLVEDLPSDVYC